MRLLQIEFIKLNRLANFILLGILVLVSALVAASAIYFAKESSAETLKAMGPMQIGGIQGLQWVLEKLLTIFLIINIGKEFSENTLKRSIIDGYTRDNFFNGKVQLMLVAVLFTYTLEYLSTMFVRVATNQPVFVADLHTLSSMINALVFYISSGIFVVFLVFISRSIAVSLVLYFVWAILEGVLKGVGQLLEATKGWHLHLDSYLPLSSMAKVLAGHEPVEMKVIAVAVAYLLVMLLLPYWLFIKRDIK